MNQDDYQKKIDEHRQTIGTENDSMESRRSRSTKKTKKKSKSLLLPSIFFIFIMIPVCILVYVQFFYVPEKEEVTDDQIIQVETKNISNNGEDKEEGSTEVDAETPKTTEPETEEPVMEEPAEEAPKVEAPKIEEPKIEEPTIETKTHQVKEGETLYRIAMNYYKNPSAVEKIKAANGLKSNDISAGQKLILP